MIYSIDEVQPKWKLLLYGMPGCGKSTFASTAQLNPNMSDILFVDFDNRADSLAGLNYNIHAVKITEGRQVEQLLAKFLTKNKDVQRFNTIIFDSLTKWSDLERIEIAKRELDKSSRVNTDISQLQDYGEVNNRIIRILTMFGRCDVNIILIAHVRTYYFNSDKLIITRKTPEASETLVNRLTAMVDHVWAMNRSENTLKILTQPGGKKTPYEVKSSGVKFPLALGAVVTVESERDEDKNLILIPNLSDIYDTYIGEETT